MILKSILTLLLVNNVVADEGYQTNYWVERNYNDFNKIKGVWQLTSPGSRTPKNPLCLDALCE